MNAEIDIELTIIPAEPHEGPGGFIVPGILHEFFGGPSDGATLMVDQRTRRVDVRADGRMIGWYVKLHTIGLGFVRT